MSDYQAIWLAGAMFIAVVMNVTKSVGGSLAVGVFLTLIACVMKVLS